MFDIHHQPPLAQLWLTADRLNQILYNLYLAAYTSFTGRDQRLLDDSSVLGYSLASQPMGCFVADQCSVGKGGNSEHAADRKIVTGSYRCDVP